MKHKLGAGRTKHRFSAKGERKHWARLAQASLCGWGSRAQSNQGPHPRAGAAGATKPSLSPSMPRPTPPLCPPSTLTVFSPPLHSNQFCLFLETAPDPFSLISHCFLATSFSQLTKPLLSVMLILALDLLPWFYETVCHLLS